MSSSSRGPNWERNRACKEWQAQCRKDAWAAAGGRHTPDFIRRKALKREAQRSRAQARKAAEMAALEEEMEEAATRQASEPEMEKAASEEEMEKAASEEKLEKAASIPEASEPEMEKAVPEEEMNQEMEKKMDPIYVSDVEEEMPSRGRGDAQPSIDHRQADANHSPDLRPSEKATPRPSRIGKPMQTTGVTVFCYSSQRETRNELRYMHENTVWVDCRKFRDPWGKTEHDGRHLAVMIPFSRHAKFGSLVNKLKTIVQERLGSGQDIIAITFWCNHGRHRSVCAAEIFGHVLPAVLNCKSIQIRHLTQEARLSSRWKYCEECKLRNHPTLIGCCGPMLAVVGEGMSEALLVE